MEDKICLDTDFLVNFLRNKADEVQFIKDFENSKKLATTHINLFELYFGAYKSKDREKSLISVNELSERLTIIGLSKSSAMKAGKTLASLEKQGKLIDFRDLLIGTIAEDSGYSVKTGNVKHFSLIGGLKVLD